MNSLKKRFALDLSAANDGVWYQIGDDVELKIARANNENFKKRAFELVQKEKIKRISKTGIFTEKDEEDVLAGLVAETILLDWKGIKNEDGSELKYTAKRAKEFLLDPEMQNFAELVDNLSSNEENYRKQFLAQAAEDAKK